MSQKDSGNHDAGLPSRAAILAFIERESAAAPGGARAKIGKREIARAFGLRGSARIALKRLLSELEEDGALERRRKRLARPGALPAMVLADVTARNGEGELVATPVDWDEGRTARIVLDESRSRRERGPAPAVGDRVLLRLRRDPDGALIGRPIKILDRARARAIGVFRANAQGGGRILPVDRKALGREIVVLPGDEGAAADGDLVAANLGPRSRLGLARATIVERLGAMTSERAISQIAIRTHAIPEDFSPAALAEAAQAVPVGLGGREDWRALALVTIDPPDAKDHDDAVHAAADDDPANPGGFVLTVAIADVAAYVRPGSALDRDALDRGNSIYFPERVVPMLPERISNDLCSLRPGADRPALAARMTIARDGRKLRHSFHRVSIRSAARLSYEQAQAAIDGAPDAVAPDLLENALRPLWRAFVALKAARDKRAPLDLDLPERKLMLKPSGAIDRVVRPVRLDAHRLIEEFMILANVAAAETLEEAGQSLIYRVHDEPTLEKVNNLSDFLASLGIKLTKGATPRPSHFNAILGRAKGAEHEALVNEVVLRAQAQAEYAAENYGHFGLNLSRYAHFTSPIRRYADLVAHRALIRALKLGPDGLPNMTLAELADIATHISSAERRATAAERETVDRLIASWLGERIGESFEGKIAGVVRAGLFVRLDETGADGFVPASTLGGRLRFDEKARALVGGRGQSWRLGDKVEVRLIEAAPFAGALRFELLARKNAAQPKMGRGLAGRDSTPAGKKRGPSPSSRKARTRSKGGRARQ